MKKLYLMLLMYCTCVSAFGQSSTYTYNGAEQTYTVPPGTYNVAVDMYAGAGGNITGGGTGGHGARVQCTLNVIPGSVLYVYLGQRGVDGNYSYGAAPAGGINSTGGADGGSGSSYYGGGAGGGSSDIRTISISSGLAVSLSSRVVVAGGGGGAGYACGPTDNGGGGGGLTGGTGLECGSYQVTPEGTPGTQTSPGLAGFYSGFFGSYSGTAGAFGIGGNAYNSYGGYGGGGGGGWFGAGGAYDGGGCGGSSYNAPGITSGVTHTRGYAGATANGQAIITPLCNPPGTVVTNSPVCFGNSLLVSNPTGSSHGTWSSDNASVASIDPTSGVVTGVVAGTATITFNVPNSCSAISSRVVTVNPVAAPIGGASIVCTGLVTILSETVTGGTWTSSVPAKATVDAFGNVTGVSTGFDSIYYTLPGGCFVSKQVVVNSAPGPILGTAGVCQNGTTILTDPVGGGTWVSGAPSIATIDVFGNVTGIGTPGAVATTNINYILSDGCTISRVFSVNPLPTPFVVSGSNTYCAGSLSTTSIVLVGSSGGVSYQLFNGPAAVGAPLTGGSGALNFGIQSAPGTYTVVGTNTTTGCVNNMAASASVAVKPLPTLFTVTGGGSFCNEGLGAPVGLSGSAIGVNYQLYKDGLALSEIIPGTGSPINFGFQTVQGNYTVVATTTGSAPFCSVNMLGSAAIINNPLPDVNNVTGGGAYCPGGTGVAIGLDFSSPGISYQLYNGSAPTGSPMLGTGGPLSFGLQTVASSSYNVIATNVTTTCVSDMAGTASISIAAPPTIYSVTGGGSGCAGTNFPVGLSGSDLLVDYQVYKGTSTVGIAVPGIDDVLTIDSFNANGAYTVVATDETSHCVSDMAGSAVITELPLPVVYNLSSGGGYCAGGAGIPITLAGSQSGMTYSLYYGIAFADSLHGTGGPLSLGTYTNAGSYTVVAVNTATSCSSNMTGTAVIAVNPLPVAYNVTGGGSLCAGADGVDIGLDLSAAGVNYQLFHGGAATGSVMPGTGDGLDFGLFAGAGTYTVVGTNPATTCTANMSGSATVSINALPAPHAVSGGGSYCSGAPGRTVSIAGSDPGISYQLYNSGVTAIGAPAAGTGSSINFGIQTLAGAYTVVATDTLTFCTRNMSGGATIVINASPAIFTVTGGGSYCVGTPGMHIGLNGSNAGVNYDLYNAGAIVSTIPGSGTSLDFGLETATGSYTILGTNIANSCTNAMAGTAVIIPKALPAAYSVIGGGSYCAVSLSIPSVGLSNSDAGVNYQLYISGVAAGTAIGGTGAAINFGTQTAAGAYTVVATDTTTGCTKNMPGSAVVTLNSLPPVNTVTGGGSYCLGGSGYHIYLSNSNAGIQYQLFNGGTLVSTITGSGSGIDFGLQTVPGTYTASAANMTTGCTNNMAGSAVININSLPTAYDVTVSDGGNYCATAPGVHVGLDGSATGINYQLYNGTTPVGTAMGGTSGALDFGIHTAGNYTIAASNATTGCTSNMTGSGMVHAIPVPNAYALTGGGNYCTTGLGLHVGMSGSDTGTVYQLYHGASAIAAPVTGTGGAVDFGLFAGAGAYTAIATNGGSTGCIRNMSGSAVITVYPIVVPAVNIATTGGDTACLGNITHFTANSINGGTSPAYYWSVNGTFADSGSTYSYLPTDGDMVTLLVHSDGICAIPDTASRTIRMTVTFPELPSVSVSVSPGDIICEGSPVTFTGTSTFGGSNPTYTWIKNSTYIAGTGLTYSYTPVSSDIIVLRMVSNFPCRLADTVFSLTNTMEVDPPVIPIVTISVDPGNKIGAGQTVTFTATVDHSGSAPVYQWLINGIAVSGATSASFTSSALNNNDSVTCEVTGGCDLQGFNSVRMHVSNVGVQQITAAGADNIRLVPNPNKGLFAITGTFASANDEEVSIEVSNALGQVVYSTRVMTQGGNINEKIQLSSLLANGIYILNLRSAMQDNVFHFVIEQ